ncbi:hypothetical protein BGW38_009312, partial [Lunasporangiospora selenospora]
STGDVFGRSTKHQTIHEEDEDEVDKALGKGITRKILPQPRRSTSSAQSSPAGSSRTSPKLDSKRMSVSSTSSQQPSALERIAIHNNNINHALATTMSHSLSIASSDKVTRMNDDIVHQQGSSLSSTSEFSSEDNAGPHCCDHARSPHHLTECKEHRRPQQQQQQQQH